MSISLPLPAGPGEIPDQVIEIHNETVQPDWIDYNGHMNVAFYVLAFDHATDRTLDMLDLGADYAKRRNSSFFVLETHVNYVQEVTLGDPLRFTLQLLDFDSKRLHLYYEMYHATEGYLAATSEQLGIHVNLASRRSDALPDKAQERLAALLKGHGKLPRPARAGAKIGIRRRS